MAIGVLDVKEKDLLNRFDKQIADYNRSNKIFCLLSHHGKFEVKKISIFNV